MNSGVVVERRAIKAAALMVSAYLAGVVAFSYARIGFRLLALENGAHTTLTVAKTTTFVFFTGPGRGVALLLVLLPFLVRGPILPRRIAFYVGGALAMLSAVYIWLQWDGELAQTSKPFGVLLVLTISAVFTLLCAISAPVISKWLRSIPAPFSLVASLAIVAVALLPAAIGALTILFNDL